MGGCPFLHSTVSCAAAERTGVSDCQLVGYSNLSCPCLSHSLCGCLHACLPACPLASDRHIHTVPGDLPPPHLPAHAHRGPQVWYASPRVLPPSYFKHNRSLVLVAPIPLSRPSLYPLAPQPSSSRLHLSTLCILLNRQLSPHPPCPLPASLCRLRQPHPDPRPRHAGRPGRRGPGSTLRSVRLQV